MWLDTFLTLIKDLRKQSNLIKVLLQQKQSRIVKTKVEKGIKIND